MTAAAPATATAPPRVAPRRPAVPRWWADAIGVLTWLSVLFVVALWVAGGGVQDLNGLASGLTSGGRLTGLVSANLLLIQVLLLARIPIVERAYGQDELVRRHRWVGFASFNLMVAHLVLIVAGYALEASMNPVAQLVEMVLDYPGMMLATVGTGLIVLVTVTSLRRARRRLRYETWHLLHLYAYLGVAFALPHQLWTGEDFLASPLATGYWWSLWVAAAGAVLYWRLAVPVINSLRHDLRVTEVVRESADVVSVTMQGRQLHRLGAAAGQFFNWRFLSGPGWSRAHPYSLSAAPTANQLRITVKNLGDGSAELATVQPGTRVLIEGPYGRLHAGVRTRRGVTLIAAGIGISPIRALLEELPQRPGDVTVLYRASSAADLVLREEIEQLAAGRGARVFYLLGPRRPGAASWLPAAAGQLSDGQALRQLVPGIADQDVFICGSAAWMDAARAAAAACGVPAERIHVEHFSW